MRKVYLQKKVAQVERLGGKFCNFFCLLFTTMEWIKYIILWINNVFNYGDGENKQDWQQNSDEFLVEDQILWKYSQKFYHNLFPVLAG